MDQTTRSVREMYEEYPYPAGTPQIRAVVDPRLLLSYVERCRPVAGGTIRVLDAGCGRGLGVIGSAIANPTVHFTGIDMNRVALEEAAQTAEKMGLRNVAFQECDLMDLSTLTLPDGGFDVLYSIGVVHHMSDPARGMQNLKQVLAPHGVISFMVYAEKGRLPVTSLSDAIGTIYPQEASLAEKMKGGRVLAAFAEHGIFANSFWESTSKVTDVEFIDRCLNVNEAAYNIDSLWELITGAGLRFTRWYEPAQWSIASILPAGELYDRVMQLDEVSRYKLVDQLTWPASYELVLADRENGARRRPTPAETDQTIFQVNPDVTFLLEKRNLSGSQRLETLTYKVRHLEPVQVDRGGLATAIVTLENQMEAFSGESWIEVMAEGKMDPHAARALLVDLVDREILYIPHPCDAVISNPVSGETSD